MLRVAVLALVGWSAGCASDSAARADDEEIQRLRDEIAEVFPERGGSVPTNAGGTSSAEDRGTGWAISLRSYTTRGHQAQALAEAQRLREQLGRRDVRVRALPSGSAVVAGSFREPGSRAAQDELINFRAMTIGGVRPFASAFLVPEESRRDLGLLPEYDLLQARTLVPGAIYTLQVGVYESPARSEAKRAAEQMVMTLRGEGEQAYYYHGRHRSMVTIGAFTEADYDERFGAQSPVIAELQRRYPHNLVNGRTLMVSQPGNEAVAQSSWLVRIPDR
ncbi:MAG: hypothetical protein AAGD00_00420 [Planctomycetota bacterium]